MHGKTVHEKDAKVVRSYEDLTTEQKIMISECKFHVIQDLARDLAKKMNKYWLQMLINELKLWMAEKEGILYDDPELAKKVREST